MTKISSVESGFYRIPLPQLLVDSTHGEMRAFELNTVRVRDADGGEGVGYTFTAGRNGGAVHSVLSDEIPEIVAGEDPAPIAALWNKLWWALHYGGRGGAAVLAISAFDIALWDLKSRRAGLPLWQMLGGFDPDVPCYVGGVDLHLSIDQLLAQTQANLDRGFRAIKMKVGSRHLAQDVARVGAVRDLLGAEVPLMVDANMRWTVDEAIRASRALAEFDLTWLEEPTIPDDPAGHARIVREGGLPVAAGENLRTLWEFRQFIEGGGVTFPEPNVTNCGGVTPFMKIAHLAEAFNLPVTSHGAHDVTIHLLAACQNRSFLESHGFGLDRYIAQPLRFENGVARASNTPGHGIEFDWSGLDKLRCH